MKQYLLSELKLKCHLPDECKTDELLKAEIQRDKRKIVVLDDDPTGVQTVHDVCVFTDWSIESLRAGFCAPEKLFFILTNSRSFTQEQTINVHKQIAENLALVSKEMNKDFLLISRGDSTLRGHYPIETKVLKNTLEEKTKLVFDGEILCPFFKEGGRFTANNIHYVLDKEILIPAGETEFAKDKTFGYTSSHLGEWIEEKTKSEYKAENVTFITLNELHSFNIESIINKLENVTNFNKVVVNALEELDLKVFCIALYQVLGHKNFLFRTASSIVKVLGGISEKALLTYHDLISENHEHGGLLIAGSHTKKTTAQLEQLKLCPQVVFIEFNQHLVMESDEVFNEEIKRVSQRCAQEMQQNRTVCVMTRRERFDINTSNKEDELKVAVKISNALTSIVRELTIQPSFVLAKGGITSSDIGTKALGVSRAVIAGQIQPGIPVWICGNESKFPGMPYIIFPGNVGEESTLKTIVELLVKP